MSDKEEGIIKKGKTQEITTKKSAGIYARMYASLEDIKSLLRETNAKLDKLDSIGGKLTACADYLNEMCEHLAGRSDKSVPKSEEDFYKTDMEIMDDIASTELKESEKPVTAMESYYIGIIKETGLEREEIDALVKEKEKELEGLVSTEGAFKIVANELGVKL